MLKKINSIVLSVTMMFSMLLGGSNNIMMVNASQLASGYIDETQTDGESLTSLNNSKESDESNQIYVYTGLSNYVYMSTEEGKSVDTSKLNSDIATVKVSNEALASRWNSTGSGMGDYNGDTIPLSKCLHTFKKSGSIANTYTIYGKSVNSSKRAYLNIRENGHGYPHSKNADEITLNYSNGHFQLSDINDTKYTSNAKKGYLYFCDWRVFSNQDGYNEYSSSTKMSNDFDIYRKAKENEQSSREIEGYVKLTGLSEISDGENYLIVSPMEVSTEKNFVLTPYLNTSDRNDHVSVVSDETGAVVTVTGQSAGSTLFEINGASYLVIVENIPSSPFVSEQEGSQAINNGVVSKITISGDTGYELGVAEIYNGKDIKWSSDNEELVSVDNGLITANNDSKALDNAPFAVTNVNVEIDGIKYQLPVVVVKWYKSAGAARLNDIYIKGTEHCSVYYAAMEDRRTGYSDSDLIEAVANEVLYVQSNVDENWGLNFFAKEKDGYALTEMAATNTNGEYFSMLGNKAEETEFYKSENSPIYKTQKSWFGDEKVKQLLNVAIEKGCVGANGYSRNSGNGNGVSTTMYFRSRKTPTVSVTARGIVRNDGQFIGCDDGVIVYPGETIYFMVTVKTYINNKVLSIANATNGAKPLLKLKNDNLLFKYYIDPDAEDDSTSVEGKKAEKLGDGVSEIDLTDYLSKDTTSIYGKEYRFYIPYTVTADDAQTTDGIKCNIDFNFSYSSQYSAGSLNQSESSNAGVVVYDEAVDDEVEVQGFQINTDTSKGAVSEYNPSFRTISRTSREMTVNGARYNVVNYGTVYAAKSDIEDVSNLRDELVVNGNNRKVYNFQATEAGRYNDYISGNSKKDSCYYYYALTIKKQNYNYDSLEKDIYFRAYAVLSNGEIVYGKNIYRVNIYDIADNLYQNRKMLTSAGHEFLYDNVLNIVSISDNYKNIGKAMLKAMKVTSSKDENYGIVNKCYKDLYYYTRCSFGYEYLTRKKFNSIALTDEENAKLLEGLNSYSNTSYLTVNDWIYNEVPHIKNPDGENYQGYYGKVDFSWDNNIYPGTITNN